MAQLTTLARPYAKAAFAYAGEQDKLDLWSETLQQLAAVLEQEKVVTALSNPLSTTEQNAQTLMGLMDEGLDSKIQNFITHVSVNKRLGLLPEISRLFDVMKANREKVVDVKVQAAYDVSEEQRTKLSEALSKNLNRSVSLEVETDSSLIGGALIHAGDSLIDGSVKGRLAKLSEAINQ